MILSKFSQSKNEIINSLTIEVSKNQKVVEQLQEIVNSLTQKHILFQDYLALKNLNELQAIENETLFDVLFNEAKNLELNSEETLTQIVLANAKTLELAKKYPAIISKLIYSAEAVSKLSNLITTRKVTNPLISDELVSLIGKAESDANNAVTLALVSLQSIFVSVESIKISEVLVKNEYQQTIKLNEFLASDSNGQSHIESLQKLNKEAVVRSKNDRENTQNAISQIKNQLNLKTFDLTRMQIKLKSLQSGLIAAQAAIQV